MTGAPLWAADYVGLKYREGGRSRAGLDCWGLVRLVLSDRAGIELPTHGVTRDVTAALRRGMAGPEWNKVECPQALDVMVMVTPTGKGHAAPMHVGVMVTPRLVLHIDEGITARIEGAGTPHINHRFFGYYRHVLRMA